MANVCAVCGKRPITGHRISHAHNLSKRRWIPNLQKIRVVINGKVQRQKVCTTCIKLGRVQKPA